jgi:HPt (histidine-containing phosphotransfer) domain-containing protein
MLETKVLKSLRGLGEDFLSELISIYLREDTKLLESIEKAAGQQDMDAGSMAAHRLRGSSYSLGVNTIGDLCREIENAFDDQQIDLLEPLINRLKDESLIARAELIRVQNRLEPAL